MSEPVLDAVKKRRDFDAAYAMWRWEMWLEGAGSYSDIDAAVTAGRMTPFTPISEHRWLQEMREGGCD